jgi:hypothetical protein
MVSAVLDSACLGTGKRLYQVSPLVDLRSDQRSTHSKNLDNLGLSASLEQTRLHHPHDMLISSVGRLS